jgi:hypothetical protein
VCSHERVRELIDHTWCRDCGALRKSGGRWVPAARRWRSSSSGEKRRAKKNPQLGLFEGSENADTAHVETCSES